MSNCMDKMKNPHNLLILTNGTLRKRYDFLEVLEQNKRLSLKRSQEKMKSTF